MNKLTLQEKIRLTQNGTVMTFTETEVCEMFGITKDEWRRYKRLAITPEKFTYQDRLPILKIGTTVYYRLSEIETWWALAGKKLCSYSDAEIMSMRKQAIVNSR